MKSFGCTKFVTLSVFFVLFLVCVLCLVQHQCHNVLIIAVILDFNI